MADTTHSRLSFDKDVRCTVDSGFPVRFDFRSVFRSKVASSLSMSRPSSDSAIIVWPLCPVVNSNSTATFILRFFNDKCRLLGHVLRSVKTFDTYRSDYILASGSSYHRPTS